MTLLRYACLAGALLAFAIALAGSHDLRAQPRPTIPEIRLMTLDPGHFHAALVQKSMYAGCVPRVHIFAPLGPDLVAHLGRIAAYNTRRDDPTAWQIEVHANRDFLDRMIQTRPGNVVVISGRNRGKIDRILQSVRAGLNVLADKPWILAVG